MQKKTKKTNAATKRVIPTEAPENKTRCEPAQSCFAYN